MRSVAALSLVIVVLLGGVVTGTVITADGGDDGLPSDVGAGDDATVSHGDASQQPSAAADGGDEGKDENTESTGQQDGATAQGDYADEPSEDLQSDNDTDDNQTNDNQTNDNQTNDNQTDNETATATPTPTQNDTDGGGSATPTQNDSDDSDEPDDSEEPQNTPTETEADEDDDSGWSLFDPSTPTPTETPTPEPTDTPSQASFEVVDASLDSDSVTVGEYVEVTAMVENRGERAGTYETELQVDGEGVATEDVFVEGGDVETVTYQVQFENPGEYEVAVSGTDAGSVEVTPRESNASDGVEVIDAVVPADMVEAGVETSVRTTVENPTDEELDATLNVTVDGEQVAEAEITLAPGERTEVSIPFEAQAGTVAVNGVEAGELRVDDSVGNDEAESADPSERSGMDLGFLILGAAIIVACAILVAGAVRWQSDDSMLSTFDERRR